MDDHTLQSVDIADKVRERARNFLAPLERHIENWDPDFRSVMWIAVAEIANERAQKRSLTC